MRQFFLLLGALCLSPSLVAQWQKINDVDYIWGPFKIYNLSLFTESGEYQSGERPLMLSLKYAKPVEGRDFAISLARSWSNLGITLPDQDNVVDRLRKIMPNIRNQDTLSYIALEDKGYFVLNDQVVPTEFNADFNQAVVSVWLDPRVEIGRKLLQNQTVHQAYKAQAVDSQQNGAETLSPDVSKGDGNQHVEPVKWDDTPMLQNNVNPESEVFPPYDDPLFPSYIG